MSEFPQDVAILFWFYKEPSIVTDRLMGIRRVNRSVPIFGLYGGKHSAIGEFAAATKLLDDLWLHHEVSKEWAWYNGDFMLANWYAERGNQLEWQQVFVHQWDLLTTIPARDFATSSQDEILLSGVRPMDEVAGYWRWIQPWCIHYDDFLAFRSHPRILGHQMWAAIFILATFTRRFLADYALVAKDIRGFIEYRLPTIAHILGYRFAPCDVWPYWRDKGDPLLNGCNREVTVDQVLRRFLSAEGIKVCHPVRSLVPWGEILR